MVTVRLFASTGDFAETFADANGDRLYEMLVAALQTAVDSKTFMQTLREKSLEFSAANTMFVGDVTFTPYPYAVVPNGPQDDHKDVTKGQFAGIIISAVFITVVLVLAVWYYVVVGVQGKPLDTAANAADVEREVKRTSSEVAMQINPQRTDEHSVAVTYNKELELAEV